MLNVIKCQIAFLEPHKMSKMQISTHKMSKSKGCMGRQPPDYPTTRLPYKEWCRGRGEGGSPLLGRPRLTPVRLG